MLDAYELDDLIDEYENQEIDLKNLEGKKVKWHFGFEGVTKFIANRIVIELNLTCPKCKVKFPPIWLRSGINNGAFPYVMDKQGNSLACLRDERCRCSDCGTIFL